MGMKPRKSGPNRAHSSPLAAMAKRAATRRMRQFSLRKHLVDRIEVLTAENARMRGALIMARYRLYLAGDHKAEEMLNRICEFKVPYPHE